MDSISSMRFGERAALAKNITARRLFELMEVKQSNLAVAADVTSGAELLDLVRQVGAHICVLKTHIDILTDYSPELIEQLQQLQRQHQFLIFEDRKFADIGNTVRLQYAAGIYQIAKWADISNAHILPGPGIIDAMREVGLPLQRGLLLLAQMSSQGQLADAAYTQKAVQWAEQYADFVCGWIAQQRLGSDPGQLVMTPGVNLQQAGDSLRQAYTTPEHAIMRGSDIIIVGRGIYQATDPAQAAHTYRQVAWQAYCKRCRAAGRIES